MEPLIAVTLLGLALYFVPAFVAFWRYHHQRWAIFWLNLFLGWTFLGWVGALAWSATQVRGANAHRAQPPPRETPYPPSGKPRDQAPRYTPYDRP